MMIYFIINLYGFKNIFTQGKYVTERKTTIWNSENSKWYI